MASVAGAKFVVAEVAVGSRAESEQIEAQCVRLARRGHFLRAEGVAEWPDGTLSGRYSFLHAVYHEVIYGRVAEARRVQLHRWIAETHPRLGQYLARTIKTGNICAILLTRISQ